MKAIILAAGMGTRLGKYTENLPKGMLEFEGKSLIQRQVDTLREAGVDNIVIIRGYNPSKISIPNVTYRENPDFAITNMVASLMEVREDMDDDILVCYSDIIFETRLVKDVLKSDADVNVLVDDEWLDYWKDRLDDWENDVESLQFDSNDNITELGTPRCGLEDAYARYIGLIKFSRTGTQALIKAFDENKAKFWESTDPWRKSKSFKQAYMTCMIQELIDRNLSVKAVHVSHGWLEFDTVEDYEKALTWSKDGTLKKYIDLSKTG